MQAHHDALASVTSELDSTTLRTFADNADAHLLLVCGVTSSQHQYPFINCLVGTHILDNLYHTILHFFISWDGNISGDEFTNAIKFDIYLLIPG